MSFAFPRKVVRKRTRSVILSVDSRVRNPQDNFKKPDSGIGCTEFSKLPPCLGVGLFNNRSRVPLILDQPKRNIICSIQMRQENFWDCSSPVHSKGDGLHRPALRRDRGRNVVSKHERAATCPYRFWPGNVSVIFVPAPSSLSARTDPPCNSMIDFTMASPSPVLAELELRAASTR
jgi:hypothetical protein